jgi:hypothetical protein
MGKIRPKQHEIDQRACALFDTALPASWLPRLITNDYGIDKEVEIFDAGKSTGLIFKVQIKGTEEPTFISDNSILSYSMSLRDIDYLCDELKIPVILIVVDTKNRVVWWHAIQIDTELRIRLAQAKVNGQEGIVIHINKNNILPDTWLMLFDKVRESYTVLAVRAVSSTSPSTLLSSISSIQDLDAVIDDFGRSAALLRSAKLDRLWKRGDYAAVKKQIDSVLESTSSPIEEKYEAYLYLSKLALLEARADKSRRNYGEIEYFYALKLKSISKGGPLHLRTFAVLSLAAAELDQLAHKDFYLYMNSEVYKASAKSEFIEPIWAMMLPGERIRAAYLVIHKYRQCHRILRFMFKTSQFSIIPLGIDLVISSMITFLLRLRRERMADAANLYEKTLRQIAETAIEISQKKRDWEEVSYIALNATVLCDMQDAESRAYYRAWGVNLIQKIEDDAVKKTALSQLQSRCDKLEELSAMEEKEEDDEDLETQKQIYSGMAKSMGIDLNDPADMLAEIVNIGIKDLDPTRILRRCRHLYFALGSSGLPARMLMLHTAGSKTLFCTLHGYGLSSLSLDSLYESLHNDHCAKCKNHEPRPEGWKWTRSWQHEQYLKYKDKFRAF